MTLIAQLSDDIRRANIYETSDHFVVEQILPLGFANFTTDYLHLPKSGFQREFFDFKFFEDDIISLIEEYQHGK